ALICAKGCCDRCPECAPPSPDCVCTGAIRIECTPFPLHARGATHRQQTAPGPVARPIPAHGEPLWALLQAGTASRYNRTPPGSLHPRRYGGHSLDTPAASAVAAIAPPHAAAHR